MQDVDISLLISWSILYLEQEAGVTNLHTENQRNQLLTIQENIISNLEYRNLKQFLVLAMCLVHKMRLPKAEKTAEECIQTWILLGNIQSTLNRHFDCFNILNTNDQDH